MRRRPAASPNRRRNGRRMKNRARRKESKEQQRMHTNRAAVQRMHLTGPVGRCRYVPPTPL
jgi:hypothetical protein